MRMLWIAAALYSGVIGAAELYTSTMTTASSTGAIATIEALPSAGSLVASTSEMTAAAADLAVAAAIWWFAIR